MEHLLDAIPYTNRSIYLIEKFDNIAVLGTNVGYQYPQEAEKTYERIEAEFDLMLNGEQDLSRIKTALFEEINAWTKCCNHMTTYLNTYRNVAASYLYCKDMLIEEGAWKGAHEWYRDYERCEKYLMSSKTNIQKQELAVKSLLGKDAFGRRDDRGRNEGDAEYVALGSVLRGNLVP